MLARRIASNIVKLLRRQSMTSLGEPFCLFNWLSGIAHHVGIHLTEFGHLGDMVFVDPLRVLRLDFYCLLKRLDANKLLPSVDGIVEGLLRIFGHLGGKGLKTPADITDRATRCFPATLGSALAFRQRIQQSTMQSACGTY